MGRRTNAIVIKPSTKPVSAAIRSAFVAPPGSAAIPFAALTHGACKWAFGEGDAMRFCGAPALTTVKGMPRPYCACHAALAFERPRGSVQVCDKGWRR